MNKSDKVIIHSNISNISYAFTVAEMAYRNFINDRCEKKILKKKYKFHDGVTATAYLRDKCVTIVIDCTQHYNNFFFK